MRDVAVVSQEAPEICKHVCSVHVDEFPGDYFQMQIWLHEATKSWLSQNLSQGGFLWSIKYRKPIA